MTTSPESGGMRPAARRSVVDLPVPEPPMMPTASPRLILKEAPVRTSFVPNFLWTFLNSMRTSLSLSSSIVADVEGFVLL